METEPQGGRSPATSLQEMFARRRQRQASSVFAAKALLDPSTVPAIVGRRTQAEALVELLADLDHGYLPPLVQVFGTPGTGKTTIVRKVAMGASVQFPGLRVVYVNLKECHSLFAAANQILFEVTGQKEPPVVGLAGIFEKLWEAVKGDKYLLLILDEIDSIFEDKRYNPSDFLYRFLRRREAGRPPLVGLITITNQLQGIEALLDTRVRSSMGYHHVRFQAYDEEEVTAILGERAGAFKADALVGEALRGAARLAAEEHGDARRALDLLRKAGELADQHGHGRVEPRHVVWADEALGKERVGEAVKGLPPHQVMILLALSYFGDVGLREHPEGIPSGEIYELYLRECSFWGLPSRGQRRFADFLEDLETQKLIGSMVVSRGRRGRQKLLWVEDRPEEVRGAAFGYLLDRHPERETRWPEHLEDVTTRVRAWEEKESEARDSGR